MRSAREPVSLTSQETAHQETAEGSRRDHGVRAVFWAHSLAPTSKAEAPEGRGAALPFEGLQSAGGDSPCLQGASSLTGETRTLCMSRPAQSSLDRQHMDKWGLGLEAQNHIKCTFVSAVRARAIELCWIQRENPC